MPGQSVIIYKKTIKINLWVTTVEKTQWNNQMPTTHWALEKTMKRLFLIRKKNQRLDLS